MNFHTYLGRLRLIGLIEGCSFLVLLGIAMPLKYGLGYDVAVKIVGSAHGGLFVLYCLSVVEVMFRYPFGGVVKVFVFWLAAAIASLVPFGTFVLDIWLKKMQTESTLAVINGEPAT